MRERTRLSASAVFCDLKSREVASDECHRRKVEVCWLSSPGDPRSHPRPAGSREARQPGSGGAGGGGLSVRTSTTAPHNRLWHFPVVTVRLPCPGALGCARTCTCSFSWTRCGGGAGPAFPAFTFHLFCRPKSEPLSLGSSCNIPASDWLHVDPLLPLKWSLGSGSRRVATGQA